ncbi:hypothetical protein Q5P01_026081 [Channa striata]|uniref:Raptor N-terminal CASPase-like domain-containing protein n=1 Tax=Channa striata TaxID=64152 RepID=A0AA88ITY5_CHASR|nr:hypothetical protein Q5P01_026081 [Channa striata]
MLSAIPGSQPLSHLGDWIGSPPPMEDAGPRSGRGPGELGPRQACSVLRVAVADCPCEDGPRLQPLPIAKSRGERSRGFSCKHAPVQLGLDGFDILYRLWTLPYNFLTRIVCATVSVIVRGRRGFPARVDIPSAPRALMKMDSDLLHSPAVGLAEEEEADMNDWKLPLAFMKKRHLEKIEGSKALAQSWRMKDRMKTVSVALVLCLNVGVDPPDVVKTSPCARLECWIDPLSMSPQKALETIGANLQKQYENWQPRARYKQSLDPTVDEVKKLCTSLRRNAKEERVLFHYNGHGVPRPTVNGEIWVFNKNYTQYIPLSIYDLQTWMGSPSIFVYDCSNAGSLSSRLNSSPCRESRNWRWQPSTPATRSPRCPCRPP